MILHEIFLPVFKKQNIEERIHRCSGYPIKQQQHTSQSAFPCSKLTIETLEPDVKHIQS